MYTLLFNNVAIAFRREQVLRRETRRTERELRDVRRNCLSAGTGLTTKKKIEVPRDIVGVAIAFRREQVLRLLRAAHEVFGDAESQLPFGGNRSYDRREKGKFRRESLSSRNCLSAGTGLTTRLDRASFYHAPRASQLPFGGNRSYDLTMNKEEKTQLRESQLPFGGNRSYDDLKLVHFLVPI